jgi:hypothetical protein
VHAQYQIDTDISLVDVIQVEAMSRILKQPGMVSQLLQQEESNGVVDELTILEAIEASNILPHNIFHDVNKGILYQWQFRLVLVQLS